MRQEITIVGFAGGGGSCEGIRAALGRSPDVALNHDEVAIAVHTANHADSIHYLQNIWRAIPGDVLAEVAARRALAEQPRIGLAWFSPDCKHFSRAKGGKPLEKNIRDLAWVICSWARLPRPVRPRVIVVENVVEFLSWGPLNDQQQPDPAQAGRYFRRWVGEFKRLGYRVDWREIVAANHGSPTSRRRLFIIARCDRAPIVWPEDTHGRPGSPAVIAGRRKPWRTAAEVIDWSIPCPSIFDTSAEIMRKHGVRAVRPLAPNTLARIARGVQRYVIEAADPFVIPASQARTCVETGKHALVAAFLCSHYGEGAGGLMRSAAPAEPLRVITASPRHSVVSAGLLSLKGSDRRGASITSPAPAQTAQGWHIGEVRAFLTKFHRDGGQLGSCAEPMPTAPCNDSFGLVTVQLGGERYVIADIGMRMLTPRELFRAQGFRDDYVIERGRFADGWRPVSKTDQIRLCGNSVCPQVAEAIVRANYTGAAIQPRRAGGLFQAAE